MEHRNADAERPLGCRALAPQGKALCRRGRRSGGAQLGRGVYAIGTTPPADARRLANALNTALKAPQFSNSKARAVARQEAAVNWPATKVLNADFNADVDGFESFVMNDGSTCAWAPGQFRYVAET